MTIKLYVILEISRVASDLINRFILYNYRNWNITSCIWACEALLSPTLINIMLQTLRKVTVFLRYKHLDYIYYVAASNLVIS